MKLVKTIRRPRPWEVILGAILLTAAAWGQEYRPSLLVAPPHGHSQGFNKAGKFYLKMLLSLGASFDDPQGIAAVKMKSEDDPSTTSDDDELTVFATNSNRHQIIYNPGTERAGFLRFAGAGQRAVPQSPGGGGHRGRFRLCGRHEQ
jgi:hypothetical protein